MSQPLNNKPSDGGKCKANVKASTPKVPTRKGGVVKATPPKALSVGQRVLENTLSQSDFARMQNVSPAQVTRWLAKNPPLPHVMAMGKKRILVQEGKLWCVGYLKPHQTEQRLARRLGNSDAESVEQQLAGLKLAEAKLNMQMRQARFDEQMGKLVAREPIQRSFERTLALVKQRIMEAPLRFAAEIASESGGDQVAIRVSLDRNLRKVLEELALGIKQIGI